VGSKKQEVIVVLGIGCKMKKIIVKIVNKTWIASRILGVAVEHGPTIDA